MADVVGQLVIIMHEELILHQNLANILQAKLQAMRLHDTAGLETIAVREQAVVNAVQQIAARRNSLLRRIATAASPRGAAVLPTARHIADQTAEPTRTKILALAAKLKEQTQNVQRLNHVIAIASRKILRHFDAIFGVIANSGRDIGLYSKAGRTTFMEQNRLVDAVV